MGDAYLKVQSGQRLRISAEAYNAMIDAAIAHKNREAKGRELDLTSLPTITVKNGSGASVAPFGVLGISAPTFAPTGSTLGPFQKLMRISGVTPVVASHAGGRFVITAERIANGATGRAYYCGVVPAKLNIVTANDFWADVQASSLELKSYIAGGSAKILWKESGTGTGKWAIVQLGAMPVPSQAIPVVLSMTSGSAGTKTTACSFVYTVKDITNSYTYLSGAAPSVTRSNGKRNAAAYGLGYVGADLVFVLLKAFEERTTGDCS